MSEPLTSPSPLFIASLSLGLVGELVPDGGEHVAEAAPVGVEVDEDELVVGDVLVDVLRVEDHGAAVARVVPEHRHLVKS